MLKRLLCTRILSVFVCHGIPHVWCATNDLPVYQNYSFLCSFQSLHVQIDYKANLDSKNVCPVAHNDGYFVVPVEDVTKCLLNLIHQKYP
mmetsp:Transcript_8353/g.16140  ORF Transcript_8353/g.16140 Transcript_8353/m.16140 type:complete len:90 (-) Transcript_8353:89-358(-)